MIRAVYSRHGKPDNSSLPPTRSANVAAPILAISPLKLIIFAGMQMADKPNCITAWSCALRAIGKKNAKCHLPRILVLVPGKPNVTQSLLNTLAMVTMYLP